MFAAYRSGDTTGAVDSFLRHVCGDDYRTTLDRVVPGAFNEALDHAELFFQAEMAAVQQWSFGPDAASRVTQPILNVLGTQSAHGSSKEPSSCSPGSPTPTASPSPTPDTF